MADPIQDLPGELWKPVVGYEGLYSVSSLGRIKSHSRPARCKAGATRRIRERLLRPTCARNGYMTVALHNHGQRSYTVHRLALIAFAGAANSAMVACHCDGDKANNAVTNLRWDTYSGNAADSVRHGTVARGERARSAKLTAAAVRSIRRSNDSVKCLAVKHGVSRATIGDIVHRRTWKHVVP